MTTINRWYDAWDNQLVEMATNGASSGDVARALADKWARPFSRSAVLSRSRKLGVRFHARQAYGGRTKAQYSEAEVEAVRQKIEAGIAMRVVAEDLGLSLSAVRRITKLHNIKAQRGRPADRGRGFGNLIFGERVSAVPIAPSRIPERVLSRDTAVSFIDRRDGQCAFPLWRGTDRTGLVCGGETLPGESWCPDCRRIVFGRPSSLEVAA